MAYSIVLADNHKLFCEGLINLFSKVKDFNILDCFSSGDLCINYVVKNDPDLLIMDYQLLDTDCLKIINEIKKYNKKTKLVVLSDIDDSDKIIKIYDLNIDGFISKDISFDILIDILKKIVINEKYYDPEILPIINKKLIERNSHSELVDKLTKREMQILICVANGMSNKEVGAKCMISERTVKNHLSNIFQKIEVSDRTQAAVFAIKNNIVTL